MIHLVYRTVLILNAVRVGTCNIGDGLEELLFCAANFLRFPQAVSYDVASPRA